MITSESPPGGSRGDAAGTTRNFRRIRSRWSPRFSNERARAIRRPRMHMRMSATPEERRVVETALERWRRERRASRSHSNHDLPQPRGGRQRRGRVEDMDSPTQRGPDSCQRRSEASVNWRLSFAACWLPSVPVDQAKTELLQPPPSKKGRAASTRGDVCSDRAPDFVVY